MVIAEAGVNHNGQIELAKELVKKAKEAGADFVKFQTFKAENLATPKAPKAKYQKQNSLKNSSDAKEGQLAMLKRLELSAQDHDELVTYCKKIGIPFLSTPFDEYCADFLQDKVPLFKVPSGEITNLPFLIHLARKKKPLIVSTGMSTLDEVKSAKKIIFQEWKKLKYPLHNLSFLHCTTSYPTQSQDVNLMCLKTMEKALKTPIGLSDHTLGIEISLAAVALGAKIIEKHFTLDRNLEGPDHRSSLLPEELIEMIRGIRNIELAMGDGIKRPRKCEIPNRTVARKGLYWKEDFPKGKKLGPRDFICLRPLAHYSPMDLPRLEKKALKRAVKKFSPVLKGDLS